MLEKILQKGRGILTAGALSLLGGAATASDIDEYLQRGNIQPAGAAAGDTVAVYNDQQRGAATDSLKIVVGPEGNYVHDPLTPVQDIPRLETNILVYPVPADGSATIRVTQPTNKAFEQPTIKIYNVQGKLMGEGNGERITFPREVPGGVYFAQIPETGLTKKFSFIDGGKYLDIERVVNHNRIDAEEKTLGNKDVWYFLDVPGYEPLCEQVTLTEGDNINDFTLEQIGEPVTIWGTSWNQRAADPVDGNLYVKTLSDGVLHTVEVDNGNFDLELAGYDLDENIQMWVGDNPEYNMKGTSIFPRGQVASSNNIANAIYPDTLQTSLMEASNPAGLFMYSIADSVWNGENYRLGLKYVEEYPHDTIHYFSHQTNFTTGEPISAQDSIDGSYIMGYLLDQMNLPNGHTLAHTDSTSSSELPSDLDRHAILYRIEMQPGNGQEPYGFEYFDATSAHVRENNPVGQLFSENIEAWRVRDVNDIGTTYATDDDLWGNPIFSSNGLDNYYSAFFWEGEDFTP